MKKENQPTPKIKLLFNRVLIKQDTPKKVTNSGILLTEVEEVPSTSGTVIIVGPGMKDYKMETKVGDHVLYKRDSGIEMMIEGYTYLLMRESEITMIM